jgi:hypothetical protein
MFKARRETEEAYLLVDPITPALPPKCSTKLQVAPPG